MKDIDTEKIMKYVCIGTFALAQVVGFVFMVIGLVTVVRMSNQKFGLTNLQPLFKMITGIVFALVGIIMIGVSYTIRWKHRVIKRLDAIEQRLSQVESGTASEQVQ